MTTSEKRGDQVFVALTLMIGAVVGLAVISFLFLTQWIRAHLYPLDSGRWHRLLLPIAGSLGIGYLLFRYFPDARGSGVPQTKASVFVRGDRITLRTVLGKFFCTSASLGSGIPLGPEGPSVQMGAGIAFVLGRKLGLSPEKAKTLIPAGTAAAIAAVFNTPLSAVLFSVEEVISDLHGSILGSVMLASAASWMVLRLLLGNSRLFDVPQYQFVSSREFGVYAVLGLAAGLVSAAFARLLLKLRQLFLRLPRATRWCHPVAGGIVVGAMGWFVPQVLGIGYGYVDQALNGKIAVRLMIVLLLLRFFAITTSYASGNAGGIFGPSLVLGALLGGATGALIHPFLPHSMANPEAYALVGMGATFAGIIRAPVTSVLMIFEMTGNSAVIVPLMIANLTSFFIASRLQSVPLYEALAKQDGIHLLTISTRSESGLARVSRIMKEPGELLVSNMTLRQALGQVLSSDLESWVVIDEEGVAGVITRTALVNAAAETTSGKMERKVIELLNTEEFPHVHTDHTLHLALERMTAGRLDALPVVSRANVRKLEGMVALSDVLSYYGLKSLGPRRTVV